MYRDGPSPLIKRENYTAPAFWIETVELTFDLDPQKTRVLNKMRVLKNTSSSETALRLDGEELSLSRVLVNGAGSSFKIEGDLKREIAGNGRRRIAGIIIDARLDDASIEPPPPFAPEIMRCHPAAAPVPAGALSGP